MKTSVEIISATECKTVNPLGKEPKVRFRKDGEFFTKEYEQWFDAENAREVLNFTIKYLGVPLRVEELKKVNSTVLLDDYYIGSIHEAEVNKETKTAIIC